MIIKKRLSSCFFSFLLSFGLWAPYVQGESAESQRRNTKSHRMFSYEQKQDVVASRKNKQNKTTTKKRIPRSLNLQLLPLHSGTAGGQSTSTDCKKKKTTQYLPVSPSVTCSTEPGEFTQNAPLHPLTSTSSSRMSASVFRRSHRFGFVRPKSPWTNSLM